jgi:glutamate carboxypeptidase
VEPWIESQAQHLAARARDDVRALVDIDSATGDREGGEASLSELLRQLPGGGDASRPPSSTPGHPDDLLVTWEGTGDRSLLLLGHIDTVVGPEGNQPLRVDGERLRGTGTFDMKGGLVIAAGVLRALVAHPSLYGRIDLLCVADEEWRRRPLRYGRVELDHDACLCFEGGEQIGDGNDDAVVVRRRGAALLEVSALGRAAHAGADADRGRSALMALARLAQELAALTDRDAGLDVVPTLIAAGEAMNRIPARGSLSCDVRAFDDDAFDRIRATVPAQRDGVALSTRLSSRFPAMDTDDPTAAVRESAARLLGRPLHAVARGGASDAAFVARFTPCTLDGLGPLGGADHSPDEYLVESSLAARAEVALATALAALEAPPPSD